MSEYNEDELVAPEWLASEFLTDVLTSSEEVKASEITVQSYDIQPATKKGDHYASIMYRVIVKYLLNGEELKKSLIIKIMPEVEGQKLELLGDTNIFETEIAMYSEVIPRFEKILRDIGDDTVLGPRCLYYTLQPRKVIVFEDLVPLGFATLRTTTLEQAKCAYMKLAKWQAISYKINAETPEYFDKYRDGIMNMQNMVDNDFFKCGITHFVELLDAIPTLRKYKPYFEGIHDTLLDDCKSSFNEYRNNPQADAYYVLCHGDFHSRNFMLKTNPKTGDWEDIMLLDFQMCFMGSIALDFIYSIYLIIDTDLRPSHIDELLYYYLTVFNETLDKIGFKGEKLKIRSLREQIFRHRKWELFLLSTFLPVWDGYRDGSLDAVKLLSSKEFTRTVYKNEKFVKELHTLLPYLERLGYFEE